MRQQLPPGIIPLLPAILLCVVPSIANAVDPKATVRVSYQDTYKLEIIGKLGRPLGELVNVRGTWARAKDRSKPSVVLFAVTHVDGTPLSSPAEFEVVSPIGQPAKGFERPSTLKYDEAPVVWELRGHEVGHGEFGRSSEQALKEANVQPKARVAPFAIDFQYVSGRVYVAPSSRSAASKPGDANCTIPALSTWPPLLAKLVKCFASAGGVPSN